MEWAVLAEVRRDRNAIVNLNCFVGNLEQERGGWTRMTSHTPSHLSYSGSLKMCWEALQVC